MKLSGKSGLTLKWQTILVRWYCLGVVSAAQLVMISLTDVLTKTICAHMVCEVGGCELVAQTFGVCTIE